MKNHVAQNQGLDIQRHETACTVPYGDGEIQFRLEFSRRRTLEIHIHTDGSVSLKAPFGVEMKQIEHHVLSRAKWIRKYQRRFAKLPQLLPARRYAEGETFRYLGRDYTLKIERGILGHVVLEGDRLIVHLPYFKAQHIKQLIEDWFAQQAKIVFQERLAECLRIVAPINVRYNRGVAVRVMKSRWGSCSSNGKVTLNARLIHSPVDCIDYVLLHELCHLKEFNHSPAFYELLSCICPDWQILKQKLTASIERRALS